MDQLKLAATLESLEPFRRFVDERLQQWNLPAALTTKVELVLEEVLTNIINYAYPDGSGEVLVQCGTDQAGKRFWLQFTDWGSPFDPLNQEAPELGVDVCEMPVGGLGIFLLRQFTEEMHYRREDDRNVLTLYFPSVQNDTCGS